MRSNQSILKLQGPVKCQDPVSPSRGPGSSQSGVDSKLGQRRRRWPNFEPTPEHRLVIGSDVWIDAHAPTPA